MPGMGELSRLLARLVGFFVDEVAENLTDRRLMVDSIEDATVADTADTA
jgi:hypothetical protein